MVQVDGRLVRVVTAGFEDRESGRPAVVFESGGGGDRLEVWDSVLYDVAQFAPVLAYDRPGVGESEPDTASPTLERLDRNLYALLRTLDVEPPYVLVGHSFGGPLIRHFAGRHRHEVAGLVYVDATGLTRTPEDQLAVFHSMNAGETERREYEEVLKGFVERMPRGPRREIRTVVEELRSAAEPPPHPDVPIAVLLSGRYDLPPPGVRFSFDFREYHDANLRSEIRRLSEWVLEAPGGMFVVAMDAGHYIHQDDPGLVIGAVERVLWSARGESEAIGNSRAVPTLQTAPKDGSSSFTGVSGTDPHPGEGRGVDDEAGARHEPPRKKGIRGRSEEVDEVAGTVSPATGRPYPIAWVCAIYGVVRSSVYRRRQSPPIAGVAGKRGQKTRWSDEQVVTAIRKVLAESPFLSEGHRKVTARLRYRGIRVGKNHVLRLIYRLSIISEDEFATL